MKNFSFLLILILILSGCNQDLQKRKLEDSYSPIDFNLVMKNLSVDTNGIIKAETWYDNNENKYGKATLYMIHKNGGKWWYNDVKNKYEKIQDSVQMFATDFALTIIDKNKPESLHDFNKWAFYIDKNDLEPFQSATGEKGIIYTDYFPKFNHTTVLYMQKANSDKWVEIDRKSFDEENNEEESWELDFINQKLQKLK